MRRGRRLGIDVGSVRIGVAQCDPEGLIATPYETVAAGSGAMSRLVQIIDEVEPIEIVVGLPVSLNGRESHAAVAARQFVADLRQHVVEPPVRFFDERLTTTAAHSLLREGGRSSKARRSLVDQAAAVLILQGCLDAERTRGTAPGETL